MLKTFQQQIIERDHDGKDIKIIIVDAFDANKGKPFLVTRVALDIGINSMTLRNWCAALGIDIDGYTHA